MQEKDNKVCKLTEILLDKEDFISKLSEKMSKLGTRDLMTLDKKVVKKENLSTQTEERKKLNSSLEILDKLPVMENQRDLIRNTKKKQLL